MENGHMFPESEHLDDRDEKIVTVKDITECGNCPLYENDCPGGVTGTPNGYTEPPCCSWGDPDKEIYAGMYDYQD